MFTWVFIFSSIFINATSESFKDFVCCSINTTISWASFFVFNFLYWNNETLISNYMAMEYSRITSIAINSNKIKFTCNDFDLFFIFQSFVLELFIKFFSDCKYLIQFTRCSRVLSFFSCLLHSQMFWLWRVRVTMYNVKTNV